jgi:hypothetical protein
MAEETPIASAALDVRRRMSSHRKPLKKSSSSAGATTHDATTAHDAANGPACAMSDVGASCVVAPALEELFFRGFLCEDIRRRTSNAALAIGVSSAIFALAHFSLPDVPSLFACGVVFALASQSRGGVRSAFVAHALFNSSVLIERAAVARAIVDAS